MSNVLEVHTDRDATEDELQTQREAFAECDWEADIATDWPRPDRGLEVWLLILAVPSGYFLKAFAEESGKKSADALASLLGKLVKSRKGEGRIEIGDPRTSPIIIVLTSEPVPPVVEALEVVGKAGPGEEIWYDSTTHVWSIGRSE